MERFALQKMEDHHIEIQTQLHVVGLNVIGAIRTFLP